MKKSKGKINKIVNNAALIAREQNEEIAKNRQKERNRKKRYMLKKKEENKSKEVENVKFLTPKKNHIKNVTCQLRRKAEKGRAENRENIS